MARKSVPALIKGGSAVMDKVTGGKWIRFKPPTSKGRKLIPRGTPPADEKASVQLRWSLCLPTLSGGGLWCGPRVLVPVDDCMKFLPGTEKAVCGASGVDKITCGK